MKSIARLAEQIAFQSAGIPEEGELGSVAEVEAVLEHFDHRDVLEQRSPERMCGNLAHVVNADEVAGQADVIEVELW